MSEEFKKEEINGEAAEETKAAEHTEEVKAETTAEQSAAETEKPQETAEAPKAEEKKTTTYSWVNPKISGKTGEENNSASTPENRTRRRQRQSGHLLQRQNIISTSHRHRVLRSRKNHSFLPFRSRRTTKRKRKNQCQPQKNGA